MPPAGFERQTPASDWPQTLALDRSPTEIGKFVEYYITDSHCLHVYSFDVWKNISRSVCKCVFDLHTDLTCRVPVIRS